MKYRSLLLWIFSILFTFGIAYYQRKTGPTYPVSGKATINNIEVSYKLIRSHGGDGDAKVAITVSDSTVNGRLKYKRFKSYDDWMWAQLERKGNELIASIPHQPPAGKVIYNIYLEDGKDFTPIVNEPIVIRFKGAVPASALLPHILFMFLAMLLSTRCGLEALVKGKSTFRHTFLTVIFLFLGGIIFGPIVQKYAFDAYWTGWPLGHDLTDNKTIIAFIVWMVAFFRMNKTKKAYGWVIAAAIVLLAVYLIPHSVLGSEIDHTQM